MNEKELLEIDLRSNGLRKTIGDICRAYMEAGGMTTEIIWALEMEKFMILNMQIMSGEVVEMDK